MKSLQIYLMESFDIDRDWKTFEKKVLDKIKVDWNKSDDDVFNTVKDAIMDGLSKKNIKSFELTDTEWNPMGSREDSVWIPVSDGEYEWGLCVTLYRTGFDKRHPERAFVEVTLCTMYDGNPNMSMYQHYIKK